jgi:hypothetical protein
VSVDRDACTDRHLLGPKARSSEPVAEPTLMKTLPELRNERDVRPRRPRAHIPVAAPPHEPGTYWSSDPGLLAAGHVRPRRAVNTHHRL